MTDVMIRCKAAVFQRQSTGEIVPAVRFCDPDSEPEGEYFTVDVAHIEGFIASIRKAQSSAQARADILRDGSEEDRRLLISEAGGQA